MEQIIGKEEAAENFRFPGKLISISPYGSGHINDTFLLTFEEPGNGQSRKILQRMNRHIFTRPTELMENIMNVTTYLRERIVENGGDPERETLNVILSLEGKPYYVDSKGEYWRAYQFISGASCYDQVKKPEDFYESAVSFGNFQRLLADYPADTLHETIPKFHDTISRFEALKKAVEKDECARAESVREEIAFAFARVELAGILSGLSKSGALPLRVTHNDTKLNNIMIDDATGKGICVIDLDTVMPGSALYDYGDSIRFGANTGAEDERDLAKVSCDLELFALYTKGFIEGCGGSLCEKEILLLPMGAKLMTLECGMRFLADYLEGDHYFKIHRPGHNLDRCRTQFRMVKDMENKWGQMQAIAEHYL